MNQYMQRPSPQKGRWKIDESINSEKVTINHKVMTRYGMETFLIEVYEWGKLLERNEIWTKEDMWRSAQRDVIMEP